jgi:prophage DNA circulation protein
MANSTESSRLRVIGQQLDERGAADFDITLDNAGYHVRILGWRHDAVPTSGSAWRGLLRLVKREAPVPEVERSYSRSEIDWLDRQYRASRAKNGVPDDYATSQMLRVVGAYAEQCRWTLTGVRRVGHRLEISHAAADGTLRTASQTYAELYDFSFHMADARTASARL